jgi:hypothetical protein
MAMFLPRYFRSQGMPLNPCLRCGSDRLIGLDSEMDGFFMISCYGCGLQHIGAFGESAARSWNQARAAEEYNYFSQEDRHRPARDMSDLYRDLAVKADSRGIIGEWRD